MQPKGPPLQRPRSVTALSGGAVVAGTRTLKDWRLAADLQKRSDRFDRWHEKRSAAWASDQYGGVSTAGPVVRSSLFKEVVDSQQASLTWHEDLVKNTFAKLKSTVKGEVGLDQLETSFAMMQIPIDASTFTRYACELLPAGTDSVNYQEFLAFHKAVWTNQSAAVRRFAGDPTATGSDAYTGSAACRRMMRSSSVPSGGSLRELRDNEGMLRSAFKRYEQSPGYLSRGELPALFQDVGLDLGIATDVGLPGSNRLHKFLNSQLSEADVEGQDKVSLHELIEIQNKYIAALEGEKGDRRPENVVAPGLKHDAQLREAMASALVSRPPSAVTREVALEDKVALVGEFRALVAEADAALPPDSPGASRKKLMQLTR